MWKEYNQELYHFGVKGMKWGVRRFQNKDGTLNAEGKKRYLTAQSDLEKSKQEYRTAVKAHTKRSKYGTIVLPNTDPTVKALNKAARNLGYSKEDLTDAKISNKLQQQKRKPKRQENLESEYLKKGMTKEEAAIAAYKRARTEKIVAVSAGVTMIAAASYVAYKHYDNKTDRIIKSGITIQNVSKNGNQGVRDAFYGAIHEKDKLKYRGLYGQQLRDRGPGDIYQKSINVTGDMKVASRDSAVKVLKELGEKDPQFMNTFNKQLKTLGRQHLHSDSQYRMVKKARKALDAGKVDKNVYEALNFFATVHNPEGEVRTKTFYNALKAKGYDAIKDVNDSKYSGYNAKNPLIVFNAHAKTMVDKVDKMSVETMDYENKKALKMLVNDFLLKQGSKAAAGYGSVFGASYGVNKMTKSKQEAAIVAKYKKEHPGTKLSYKEIVRNHYNE